MWDANQVDLAGQAQRAVRRGREETRDEASVREAPAENEITKERGL